MKKFKNLFFVVLFVLTLALAGCGHKHEFSSAWEHDDVNHWHQCTTPDCEEKSDVEAHSFGEWKVTVEPTETTKGTRVKTCTVCSYEVSESINELAHTHALTHVSRVEADCTKAGNIEYYHCEKCGKNYLDEAATQEAENVVIAKLSHLLSHVDAVSADCTKDGNVEYYHCEAGCNKNFADSEGKVELESVVDPKKPHHLTHHDAVPATYTKDGTIEYYSCDAGCGLNYADKDATTVLESIVDPMKQLVYGTKEAPLTVDVAYDEINKLGGGESSLELGYVKGIIVSEGSYYNTKNKYYSINIASTTDSTKVITVFKPVLGDNVDGIYVGDTIVVSGKYLKFEKEGSDPKLEICNDVTIYAVTHSFAVNYGTKETPLTVSLGYDFADKLISSAYSLEKGFVKGYVLEISGKNVTIGDAKDATKVLVVYNGTKDESYTKDMEVGDLVVVEAYFQKFVSNNVVTLELSSSPKFYLDHIHELENTSEQVNPTLTETGIAATTKCKHCDFVGGGEVIPVLTDETVWTKSEVAPTYNAKGQVVYSSEKYGVVTMDGAAKLVAPYDNKTYYAVALDASSSTNRSLSLGTSWAKSSLILDENGNGIGSGYPFMGVNQISMIDEKTGKVSIKVYDLVEISEAQAKEIKKNGGYVTESTITTIDTDPDSMNYGEEIVVTIYRTAGETFTEYVGYVDFETGIIVRPFSNFYNNVLIYTPYTTQDVSKKFKPEVNYDDLRYDRDWDKEKGDWKDEFYDFIYTTVGTLEDVKASAWSDGLLESMAITYKVNDSLKGIFISNEQVHFDVQFSAFDGTEVKANEAYKAEFVSVKSGETVISEFVKKNDVLVLADGLQGTYTNGTDKLVLSGAGVANLTKTVDGVETEFVGTYDANELTVIVDNKFYSLTIDKENKTFTLTYVEVEITYVNEGSQEVVKVNKNIPMALQKLTKEGQTLMGWFLDSACTQPVVLDENGLYVPTSDVTLYAKWANNVTIELIDVIDGSVSETPLVITGVAGDALEKHLPAYDMDEAKWAYFAGWFTSGSCADQDAVTDLSFEIEESEEPLKLYAKWVKLPVYYGSYAGVNTDGKNNIRSATKTLVIDKDGAVSGNFTGNVTKYDPETKIVTIVANGRTYYFWFNEEAGILVTKYNGATTLEIGYDTDTYVRGAKKDEKPIVANCGLGFHNGASSRSYLTRIITVATANGEKTVLFKDNVLYNVTEVTDAFGAKVEVANIYSGNTLIVKGTEGTLLAVGTTSQSFATSNSTINPLDEYYGVYTNGDETIKLNGVGGILVGELLGTYELKGDHFDVYLTDENNLVSYYSLVLTADSYVLTKEMAEIVFDSSVTAVPSVNQNVNISFDLPVLANTDTHVFRGWYTSADFSGSAITSYTPTETGTVTLYAKWLEKVTLTINYNNGLTEATVVEYGKGEIVTIEKPKYEKHKFVKWTDANGVEFVNGTAINENTVVNANWEDAPIYNQNYYFIYLKGTSKNGGTTDKDDRDPILKFDPEGFAPNPSSWPFYGKDLEIINYNKVTGTFTLVVGSSEKHEGFIDLTTGIMIVDANTDGNFSQVWMLQPFEKSSTCKTHIKSAYWNNGKTRVIEYTFNNTAYTAFINDKKVVFGVSFKDVAGEAIDLDTCYNAQAIQILDKENNLIAYYGFNGTTMVLADEYRGTYTNGSNTIVMDGIKTVTINDSTFNLENAMGLYEIENIGGAVVVKAFVNEQYFEITLGEGTYTLVKPMVELTVDLDGGTGVDAQVSYNKSVEVTLPVPTKQGFVFKGYLVGSATTPVFKLTPTVDTTIKATWVEEVTLHVVYNTVDGVSFRSDEEYKFGKGDTISFEVPTGVINGYALTGWTYNGAAYTLGKITENMTINAVWTSASIYYGEYLGFEFWGNSSKPGNTDYMSGSALKYAVDFNGKMTGSKTGQLTYNEEKAVLKVGTYYAAFDEENGVLAFDYKSNTSTFTNDFYIAIRGYNTVTTSKDKGSAWDGGKTRLIEFTLDGTKTMNVFVFEGKVYGNVSIETTDGTANASNAYQKANLTLKDSKGNIIVKLVNNNGTFTKVTE